MSETSDAFDPERMPCSYCGKSIFADSPRCPACGNYTDGLGEFDGAPSPKQHLPRIWIIAGWLALAGIVAPFLIAVYWHFKR